MDTQAIINVIVIAGTGTVGWFARQLWEAVKELRRDLHQIEKDMPTNYVQKIDLDRRMEHIEQMFQRIYDKLEAKADKP